MTEKQKEQMMQILEWYGAEKQRDMLQEECAELIQAVSKLRRYGEQEKYMCNFIEEMADISILLEQMRLALTGAQEAMFAKIVDRKIQRTLERIGEEKAKL